MFVFYVILSIVIVVTAVVLIKFFQINITLFVAAAAVALLIPLPVYAVTTSIAKNDQQTFHEYWNGYETAATTDVTECQRDGSCQNTFQCDPYTTVEIEYYTDSEGKQQSRTVTKTHYHSCPYSTQETSYYVDSTVESFTIASHLMTGQQYRSGWSINGGQVLEAPKAWVEAKTRIDSGKPGPVTVVKNYKNFILSSELSLFKKYSAQIDDLVSQGMLPAPVSGTTNFYKSPKAYFVGKQNKNVKAQSLTTDVAYLNGAVGDKLHGDLHVVFVDSKVGNSTDYSNSLMAYWQDSKTHGKNAISKNSIVVVIGVENYSAPSSESSTSAPAVVDEAQIPVDIIPTAAPAIDVPKIKTGTPVVGWVKAFTGMPLGNEAMLTQIESSLKGSVVDKNLIGRPTFNVSQNEVKHTDGKLENILFGVNKFERVSMSANDSDDSGSGFNYLAQEWVPDAGTMTLIFWLSSIFAALALAFGGLMSYTVISNEEFPDFIKTLITKERK